MAVARDRVNLTMIATDGLSRRFPNVGIGEIPDARPGHGKAHRQQSHIAGPIPIGSHLKSVANIDRAKRRYSLQRFRGFWSRELASLREAHDPWRIVAATLSDHSAEMQAWPTILPDLSRILVPAFA
jgi:hypothetical protein